MSDYLTLSVKSSPVPEGFCPNFFTTPAWLQLVSYLRVQIPITNFGVVISESRPTRDLQTTLWYKIDALGRPERAYLYGNGDWLSPFETTAQYERRFVIATEAEIITKDGGSAGTVSDRTGPFWEIDTDMAGFIPIGVGKVGGVDGNTELALSETMGEEKHSLSLAESGPSHHHVFGMMGSIISLWIGGGHPVVGTNSVEAQSVISNTANASYGNMVTSKADAVEGTDAEAVTAHNNMPPVRAGYWIKRTARLYYVG